MTGETFRRPRLVVVGNGMAGIRAGEEPISRAPHRCVITVFGAEPHPNYSRILLSAVLAGEKTLDDIVLNSRDWYEQHGICLIAGKRATAIHRVARRVELVDGTAIPFDKLLLATGSKPLAPPIPGLGLRNVRAFRDIGDVEAMIAAASTCRRAAVIGGGLLGLEAAWGLKRRGMSVALVHLMPTLMERQLDAAAGELLRRDLEARGIDFFTSSETEEILGTERAEAVLLADGNRLAADLVVLASGSAPTSIWPLVPGSTSTAASWSATTWRAPIRISMPWVNASSITARCLAWSRRSGNRRAYAAPGSPVTMLRFTYPSPSSPASRSPGSTSSRPGRLPPPTMATRRLPCMMQKAVSTRS